MLRPRAAVKGVPKGNDVLVVAKPYPDGFNRRRDTHPRMLLAFMIGVKRGAVNANAAVRALAVKEGKPALGSVLGLDGYLGGIGAVADYAGNRRAVG